MTTMKASIIILLTLLTGIVIGVLGSGWIWKSKLKAFVEYRTEDGFRRVALQVLDPDEEQMEEVLPIINDYARLNRELNASYRRDLDALQVSYWSELQPYLTEAQVRRLVGTAPMGPPPGGPGPEHSEGPGEFQPPMPQEATPGAGKDSIHSPRPKPRAKIGQDTTAGITTEPDTFFEPGPPPHVQPGGPGHGPGPVERAERFSLMMKNQLLLEEEQYQAVRKVNLDHAFRVKEIHDRYRNSGKRGLMAELATAEAERDQKISTILTPSQYQQYSIMMDRIKKAWVHKRRR